MAGLKRPAFLLKNESHSQDDFLTPRRLSLLGGRFPRRHCGPEMGHALLVLLALAGLGPRVLVRSRSGREQGLIFSYSMTFLATLLNSCWRPYPATPD